MSRNFELLQKLGEAEPASIPAASGPSDGLPLTVEDGTRPNIKVSRAVRDEVVRLVRSVFLSTGTNSGMPVHNGVVFCGLEPTRSSSRLTSIVGEILAEKVPNANVCLVDSNLSNPTMHEYFALSNLTGFCEALQAPLKAHEFTRRLGGNLWLMTSGGGEK